MPPKTRAPKAPKAPKPVKLSKKALDVLDKAEIRHVAVRAMGLSPNDGAYRFTPSELTNWVLENQQVFAQADLSVCQESILRPGVLTYIRDLQATLRGEGPAATWPPQVCEPPQPDEQESPVIHDFPEMDDEDDLAEDELDDTTHAVPPEQVEAPAEPISTPPETAAAPEPAGDAQPHKQGLQIHLTKESNDALLNAAADEHWAELTAPRPVRRPTVLPPPTRKPGFMPVSREPAKPAPAPEPAPAEQPGLITENLSNMNNRMNELFDKLEVVSNLLDSRHQQLKSDLGNLSTKSRTDAIEKSVRRLEESNHMLSMAMLHIINTIRPWAESGVATFPNLESLPDTSMYGDEIVRTLEDSHG